MRTSPNPAALETSGPHRGCADGYAGASLAFPGVEAAARDDSAASFLCPAPREAGCLMWAHCPPGREPPLLCRHVWTVPGRNGGPFPLPWTLVSAKGHQAGELLKLRATIAALIGSWTLKPASSQSVPQDSEGTVPPGPQQRLSEGKTLWTLLSPLLPGQLFRCMKAS